MEEIAIDWTLAGTSLCVEIHMNSKNCYAYMYDKEDIVADVWLFNVEKTPAFPPWLHGDGDEAPFSNSIEFCNQDGFAVPKDLSAAVSGFYVLPDQDPRNAIFKIFIDNIFHAALVYGKIPGYCRLTTKSGPAASCIEDFRDPRDARVFY